MIQNGMIIVRMSYNHIVVDRKCLDVEIGFIRFEFYEFFFVFICCCIVTTHSCYLFQVQHV